MNKYIIIGVVVLVVLSPLVWYLASPLFIDDVVDEEMPISNPGSLNYINENQDSKKTSISTKYQGSFTDAEFIHKASGTAKIISDSEKTYLRFENFRSTNGPDLYVYLSTDTDASDFVSLGRLKGNIGNQNYEISEDVNLEKYGKVLIWCQRFGVLFGSAELEKVN